jgi:microsomal epoxide hydrolase
MRELVAYWTDVYDWRAWEQRFNSLKNYRVAIGGQLLHYIIEQGSGTEPLPLLLLHGWPGSIVEFLQVIEPLAHPERFGGNPRDAFTVVVPSLPGFGFSPAPAGPLHPRAIAASMSTLMRDVLGFRDYVAQGGDWGAIVGSWIALDHAEGLRALHLNGPGLVGGHAQPEDADAPLTQEELDWLQADARPRRALVGYQHVQGMEPQNLAFAMTDSPAGLAAWLIHRFQAWTGGRADQPPPFERDLLLTNIMLYWLGGIAAPNWLYVSLVNGSARKIELGRRIAVPTGFTFCPSDNILPAPMRWIQRSFSNVVSRKVAPSGGHFLAFEQPAYFTQEVRGFFRPFRRVSS